MNQRKGQNDRRKYFIINLHERMLPTRRGSNPQPPDHQSDTHPAEPEAGDGDIASRKEVITRVPIQTCPNKSAPATAPASQSHHLLPSQRAQAVNQTTS